MDENIKYSLAYKTNGTSLVGYIKTTYDELVKKLGEPNYGPSGDQKVTCEWILEVDGDPCTIYDWKTGKTPKDLHKWHVGGTSSRPLRYLAKRFGWETSKFTF